MFQPLQLIGQRNYGAPTRLSNKEFRGDTSASSSASHLNGVHISGVQGYFSEVARCEVSSTCMILQLLDSLLPMSIVKFDRREEVRRETYWLGALCVPNKSHGGGSR